MLRRYGALAAQVTVKQAELSGSMDFCEALGRQVRGQRVYIVASYYLGTASPSYRALHAVPIAFIAVRGCCSLCCDRFRCNLLYEPNCQLSTILCYQ